MPDEITNGAQPNASASTTPASTPGVQGTTDQAAEWNKHFKSADDMYKSYGELQSKLGAQGNELGQHRQAAQEAQAAANAWNQWYRQNLQPHWGEIQKLIQAGGQMPQQAQPQIQQQGQGQQAAQWAEGWDLMSPQEQAQRLHNVLLQNAVQQVAQMVGPSLSQWQQQFVNQYNADLQKREAYYNNYLDLYRRVMDMRMQDPTLDVDKVLDQAVSVMSNQVNPLELGKTLATMGADRDSYAKQMVESARKDWEQEQKNKEMAAVGGTNAQPPAFRPPSAGGDRGLSGMREQVAQRILEKHGPGVFGGR